MKTINDTQFLELKPDYFYYCNKKYERRRFISVNNKILITSDNGFTHVRIFIGTKEGTAKDVTENLFNRNLDSFPVYSTNDIKKLPQGHYIINVHTSHFKKNLN